jgi:hypothetical protein
MFDALFASGVFYKDPPHGFGGGSEEMGASLPVLPAGTVQPQPRFMNQGGGLERLPGTFMGEPVEGELAQLIVHQRQQLLCRVSAT